MKKRWKKESILNPILLTNISKCVAELFIQIISLSAFSPQFLSASFSLNYPAYNSVLHTFLLGLERPHILKECRTTSAVYEPARRSNRELEAWHSRPTNSVSCLFILLLFAVSVDNVLCYIPH